MDLPEHQTQVVGVAAAQLQILEQAVQEDQVLL